MYFEETSHRGFAGAAAIVWNISGGEHGTKLSANGGTGHHHSRMQRGVGIQGRRLQTKVLALELAASRVEKEIHAAFHGWA
eukprot:2508460-Amphidinium_carterae.1